MKQMKSQLKTGVQSQNRDKLRSSRNHFMVEGVIQRNSKGRVMTMKKIIARMIIQNNEAQSQIQTSQLTVVWAVYGQITDTQGAIQSRNYSSARQGVLCRRVVRVCWSYRYSIQIWDMHMNLHVLVGYIYRRLNPRPGMYMFNICRYRQCHMRYRSVYI